MQHPVEHREEPNWKKPNPNRKRRGFGASRYYDSEQSARRCTGAMDEGDTEDDEKEDSYPAVSGYTRWSYPSDVPTAPSVGAVATVVAEFAAR
eukprot:gene30138-22726_t